MRPEEIALALLRRWWVVALAALAAAVLRAARRGASRAGPEGMIALALAIALADAILYQGLTGSFEDARHVWALLGLAGAVWRLEMKATDSIAGRDSALKGTH